METKENTAAEKRQRNVRIVQKYRQNILAYGCNKNYIFGDELRIANDMLYNFHVAIQDELGLPHNGETYAKFLKQLTPKLG